MELIEHLECIKEELQAISEEGAVVHNDSLRHDVKIARELIPKDEFEKLSKGKCLCQTHSITLVTALQKRKKK